MVDDGKLVVYYTETAGMLADRMRPLVLASCDGPEPDCYGSSCMTGTPMIPIHRATLSAIYGHLERLAQLDGEITQRMREYPVASDRLLTLRASTPDVKP